MLLLASLSLLTLASALVLVDPAVLRGVNGLLLAIVLAGTGFLGLISALLLLEAEEGSEAAFKDIKLRSKKR